VIAPGPFPAGKRQVLAGGAIPAARPGLPRHRWCGEGRTGGSGPGRSVRYEIRVDGVLDGRWAD
jgi:hypothetical protein